jgi:hypothetical protein
MFLVDVNIFLEILLNHDKIEDCRRLSCLGRKKGLNLSNFGIFWRFL